MSVLFIGLGTMGAPMVRHLATSHDVVLHDVDAVRAAALADELGGRAVDLVSVPRDVDTLVLMVPSSRVVETILCGEDGLLARLAGGSLIIDMSSSEPASTRRLASLAAERSIDYADAPVSGGMAKAETGDLTIMVGAEESTYVRALPVLQSMGASIIHVGPPGAGDAAKALNNLLSATNIAAVAEVLSAATRFGIDPAVMLQVLNGSTGRSQASEVKYPAHVLTGAFASGFGMDLMLKDLAIAQEITTRAGLTAPVTEAAHLSAQRARELAGAHPDHTEIVRYYERANNTLLRSPARPE